MCLIKEDGTNVKRCSHVQLWALLRVNTQISSDHGGLEVSGLCRQRPGGNRPAVRKDVFAPRTVVLLLKQIGEQWQKFSFICIHL